MSNVSILICRHVAEKPCNFNAWIIAHFNIQHNLSENQKQSILLTCCSASDYACVAVAFCVRLLNGVECHSPIALLIAKVGIFFDAEHAEFRRIGGECSNEVAKIQRNFLSPKALRYFVLFFTRRHGETEEILRCFSSLCASVPLCEKKTATSMLHSQ